jgi:hypothetical protein
MNINDIPQTPGVYLALFSHGTCIYATDRKVGYVLRKLQRGLSSIETWYEHSNIKFNEERKRGIESSTSLIDLNHLRLTSH